MRVLRTVLWLAPLLLVLLLIGPISPISGGFHAHAQSEDSVYLPTVLSPATAFSPTGNITLAAGSHLFTEFFIPAGVTVTLAGDVNIQVLGDSRIEGVLFSDCAQITVRGQGALHLTGLVRHVCDSEAQAAQEDPDDAYPIVVRLVIDGPVQVGIPGGNSTNVIAAGSIFLTDSMTENESFAPIDEQGRRLHSAQLLPQRFMQSSPAVIDGVLRPEGRGDLRLHRDGDVTLNAAQTAPNGADGGALVQAGTCDAATVRGRNGGTISLGARGGTLRINANLTAGDGGAGGHCTAPNGCPAIAKGGRGGRGGSILVGGQSVVFAAGITLTRGNGGAGGDATATGNDGAAACDNGCDAVTTGGVGGLPGGIGYVLVNPGQVVGQPSEAGGNGGKGGDATATAGNGMDCDQCPAGKGGDGGIATATAGKGGDGARGRIWPIVVGSHRSGDGGNATGTGGKGGKGADCCAKLADQAGGDGGQGGDTNVIAGGPGDQGINKGNDGVAAGSGGNGGNGGDGTPPGAGGIKGSGFGNPDDIQDGVDGQAGKPCPLLTIWFIYYSTIPDGPLLPGVPITVNTYITTTPSITPTGEVVVRPLTPQEFGGPVLYVKDGEDLFILSGGLIHDLTRLQAFPVISVRALVNHQCQTVGCAQLIGLVNGQPAGQVGNQQAQPGLETIVLPPPEDAPAYDGFILQTTEPLKFNHWWIAILDP